MQNLKIKYQSAKDLKNQPREETTEKLKNQDAKDQRVPLN